MATQRTGVGGNPPNEQNKNTTQDTVEVAGRNLHRVDMAKELAEAARAFSGPSENPIMTPGPKVDPAAKEEVDRMMPEFLKNQTAAENQVTNNAETEEHVEMAALLAEKIVEARKDENHELAESLKKVLNQMMGGSEPKRVREKKAINPVLAKLRRNLGLKRITPTEVEWGGSTWRFALAPAALDRWVANLTEQGVSNFSALKISANLTGIDGVPLYEVFNVDTKATFRPDIGTGDVTVRLYDKRCDACGEINDVDLTICPNCDNFLDPFDTPLNLRLQCAELVHRFFLEDFGPYEELRELYTLMREQLPDRSVDKERLYPFLMKSPDSSKKTGTTPSGDEQSLV